MTLTKLKQELFEKIYGLNSNISKIELRKAIDEFGKHIMEENVPKITYDKTYQSKEKWKQKCSDLNKDNAQLKECQRILGVVGKLK